MLARSRLMFVTLTTALAGFNLVGCSTVSPKTPEARLNEFQFSPSPDGSILVDALFHYPDLGTVEALSSNDVAFGSAASAYCHGQYAETGAFRWCHEAQPKGTPGTVIAVCKTIRCAGISS